MSAHLYPLGRLSVLVMLLAFLLSPSALCAQESDSQHDEITYGYSENGRALVCHRIGAEDASRSMLLVFGVHGFEDAYDHDGEVLRLIAQNVIDAFSAETQTLEDFALYIVPCANPDGLLEGTSNNGFGRCNANGLDINRDFPINWKEDYHSRVKTGSAPFSTAEARALRDLVEQLCPTFAADVHGWIDAVYGSGDLANAFSEAFGMKLRSIRSGGTLAQWLQSEADEAILLELPPEPNEGEYVTENSDALVQAVRSIISADP